jgi:hypothetical protein
VEIAPQAVEKWRTAAENPVDPLRKNERLAWTSCAGPVDDSLKTRGSPSETLVVAGVSFGCAAVLAATLLAWLSGELSPAVSAVALLVGAIVGAVAARSLPPARTVQPFTRWDAVAMAAFAAVALRQFLWIVFEDRGFMLTLLPHNFGDLPLHWTYVQQLASRAPFWPENPILTGTRLRYPLGVDLLTAALVSLGADLPLVLKAMGLAGSLLTALALRRWGGAFAVAGFLLCGGLAGLPALVRLQLVDVDALVAWKNLFMALFVPQRGFLLALPAGLLLLDDWRRELLRGEPARLPRWLQALVWAALPIVHLHTFGFVSLVFGVWAVGGGRWRAALASAGLASVPAALGVLLVTGGLGGSARLAGWAPGWVMGSEPPLVFLARNFGLWLPLAAAALAIAVREKRGEALLVLGPSLALFAALFVVRLAPWAWDNTKVMLWCLVAALPCLETVVLARLRPVLRAVSLALLFGSGAVSALYACFGPLPRLELLNLTEYREVCAALERVPTTRVATLATFNHPVALCGRPIVAGYAGHLWSHGFDASVVEARLRHLLLGAPGWQDDARALGASHVFWGAREASTYPTSQRPWETLGPPVASGSWGALYSLR